MYMVKYTSDDFKANLAKSDLAIIPIGSVEAHGHHLPLGTDVFSPRLFCSILEKKIGEEIWITPEIPFGQSYDLSIYPGTVHVPTEIFAEYVFAVGKSLYENGIKKIIFMNGHGGNINGLNLASEKLMMLGAEVLTINWWLDYSKDILTITEGQGHGGEDETSVVLYYDEELVHMDKAIKNMRRPLIRMYFKDRGSEIYRDAISGDATLATREKGKQIFKLLTDKMIDTIRIVQSGKYYNE